MTDSELIALCRDALFSTSLSDPVVPGRALIDAEKWRLAVAALNGEATSQPVPDWRWSPLHRRWILAEDGK